MGFKLMKKTAYIFALSLILSVVIMFSCGGGGGGADNAIEDNSFSIGYNANGAESGTAPSAQNGNGKEVLSVSANTGSLSKAGYLFDGWNTSADGSGADYAPGALYNGKNIILYAKWAAIFNYSINSISPAPSLDGAQMAPSIFNLKILGLTEKGRTLSNVIIPEAIDGYTVSSISDNAFQDCSNLTEVTIPNTVTEIGDSAFSGCSNLTDITMKGTVPPAVGADAFAGCVQLAVSVPQSAASAYNSSPSWSTVVILAPGTFSIIYNGNGSDGGIVPQRQVGMTGVTILVYGNNGSLTRAGCTFNGWNTKADGTGNRFVEDGSYAGPDNMTLYAQWTHPDYVVIFDSQGADINASPANMTIKAPVNSMDTLPKPPYKNDYRFDGWFTEINGGGNSFTVGSPVVSSMTVYAKWTYLPMIVIKDAGLEIVSIPGKDFVMLTTEVTQKLYSTVMGNNPSKYIGDNLPVECVTWYDAINFCNELSKKSGLTSVYTINEQTVVQNISANGFRLPTSEEWEYAAKGGRNYTYSGSNSYDEVAWTWDNRGNHSGPHPVGLKKANDYGLYDMSGNVSEWCWDVGSEENRRIYRGGSWSSSAGFSAVTYYSHQGALCDNDFGAGFRVVRNVR